MKRLILIAVIGLSLAGCAGSLPTLNLQNQVNLNTEAGIVSGYGLAVNAENALKAQPLCKTGTTTSISNICVKRSLIVRLQNADKVANAAVNQLVAFTQANPTVSPSNYISAAQAAILAVQSVINAAHNGG
jgi:hypothetical protein